MKFSLKSLFIIIMLFAINVDMDAQRKRKRVRPSDRVEETAEPQASFTDNLNYEIKVGNIGIGNSFSLSAKPSVGYKFHKFGSAGVGSRMFYTFINRTGLPDVSFFDYGFFGYGRVRLNSNFYLQGEYTTYSLDGDQRTNISYPLFGAGYLNSGGGPWSYGFELLFIGDEVARDNIGSVVEWWLSFSYNF